MSVKLSVIIPVYNSQKYLVECLSSVCNYSYQDIEVIIIDDYSTDKSLCISQNFLKKFNFIKIFALKKNRGVSYCRNLGIKNAKGDYICFIDSDDKLIKNGIKIILNQLEEFKGKDVFFLKNLILNNLKKKSKLVYDYAQTFKFKKNSSF